MAKPYQMFVDQLTKIRSGTVSPAFLDTLKIEYQGSLFPLAHLAYTQPVKGGINIILSDPTIGGKIAQAIQQAGFNAYVSGKNNVMVSLPPVYGEDKLKIIKQIKKLEEDTKVAIRNIRKKIRQSLSEDELKRQEKSLQTTTDEYIRKVEAISREKVENL